jgi:hypothetical protein
MPLRSKFFQKLRDTILIRLETPNPRYRHHIFNNLEYLYRFIRKGDVVLVEGRSKMSSIIKFNIIETGTFDYKALRWHQRL